MEAGPATEDVTVRDDRAASRFEVLLSGERAGFADYEVCGYDVVVFPHTVVEPRFQNRGLATRLIDEALAAARDRGWSVLPECSFVRLHLRRHPELVDLVPASERARFGLA